MNFPLRPTPRLFRQLLLWASLLMVGSGWVDLRDTLSQIPASASARLPLPRLGTWLAGRLETGGLATGEATQGLFLPLFALASVVFVLLFWLRAHAPGPQADRLAAVRLLLQMGVAVLLDPWIEPGLIYLVAADLAFTLPLRQALAGLLAQIVLNGLSTLSLVPGDAVKIVCNLPTLPPPPLAWLLAMNVVEGSAFQVFSFFIGCFACAEMQGRRQAQQLYEDLVRLQDTLAETVGAAERSRITLSVQAVIQGQLKALDTQMALALAQTGGPGWSSVQTAHALTQSLGAQVQALGAAAPAIELRSALDTLCRQIPSPRIVLDLGETLEIASSTLAHAIFRIIQEATSNAVHHAAAGVLHIAVSQSAEAIELRISDDGRGMAAAARPGSGLRGMRDRVAEHGGRMTFSHPAQGGFGLHIWLPCPGASA